MGKGGGAHEGREHVDAEVEELLDDGEVHQVLDGLLPAGCCG